MAIKVKNRREAWWLENQTDSRILIGDLPRCPPLRPNKSINILNYATKQEIGQSKTLVSLVRTKRVILKKLTTGVGETITTDEAGLAVTSAEENELLDIEITEGETITEDTEGVLIFGKAPDDTAQAIGVSGPENNEIKVISLDTKELLDDILTELAKMNMQMAIISGNEIKNRDL